MDRDALLTEYSRLMGIDAATTPGIIKLTTEELNEDVELLQKVAARAAQIRAGSNIHHLKEAQRALLASAESIASWLKSVFSEWTLSKETLAFSPFHHGVDLYGDVVFGLEAEYERMDAEEKSRFFEALEAVANDVGQVNGRVKVMINRLRLMIYEGRDGISAVQVATVASQAVFRPLDMDERAIIHDWDDPAEGKVLSGPDMLTKQDFAQRAGFEVDELATMREANLIIGFESDDEDVYPDWQLSENGRPHSVIPQLFELLGDAWEVNRYMRGTHQGLGGSTGLEAVVKGDVNAVLSVAAIVSKHID